MRPPTVRDGDAYFKVGSAFEITQIRSEAVFIPYFAFTNRGKSDMAVRVRRS